MTLNEQIQSIMYSERSNCEKEQALIGLGLRPAEIGRLMQYYGYAEPACPLRQAQRTRAQVVTTDVCQTETLPRSARNSPTLNDQVRSIMRSEQSDSDKERALVELGILGSEMERVWQYYAHRQPEGLPVPTPQPRQRRPRRRPLQQPAVQPPMPQTVISIQPTEMLTDSELRYAFGVEIECGLNKRKFCGRARANNFNEYETQRYNHNDLSDRFKFVSDASVRVEDSTELVSPILSGAGGLEKLRTVCTILSEAEAKVNITCGLHVHIDAHTLSKQHYLNVFINYQRIERIIDTFMSPSRRASHNFYCRTIKHIKYAEIDANYYYTTEAIANRIDRLCNNSRYYKVNHQAFLRHKSLEFRQHQGSVDFVKICNWIKFLQLLVAWSERNTIDADNCRTINDLPFLTDELKEYYTMRANHFACLTRKTSNN